MFKKRNVTNKTVNLLQETHNINSDTIASTISNPKNNKI